MSAFREVMEPSAPPVAAAASKLPELPEPDDYGTMLCEDCNGAGEIGDEIYQGEFQPPEREQCTSCSGSGRWKTDLFRSDTVRSYAQSALDQAGGSKPAEGSPKLDSTFDVTAASEKFAEYFIRNYPGRPGWHAPKIFRAALYALESSALPAAPKEPQP